MHTHQAVHTHRLAPHLPLPPANRKRQKTRNDALVTLYAAEQPLNSIPIGGNPGMEDPGGVLLRCSWTEGLPERHFPCADPA
jgi:hypothetical protein